MSDFDPTKLNTTTPKERRYQPPNLPSSHMVRGLADRTRSHTAPISAALPVHDTPGHTHKIQPLSQPTRHTTPYHTTPQPSHFPSRRNSPRSQPQPQPHRFPHQAHFKSLQTPLPGNGNGREGDGSLKEVRWCCAGVSMRARGDGRVVRAAARFGGLVCGDGGA